MYKLKYIYNKYITNNILLNLYILPNPFIKPSFKFYFGKIQIGTPYFYPRIWKKNKNGSGKVAKYCKYFKIDIVNLGYKTKWSDTDYRFEWSPLLSIILLNKQFCIFLVAPNDNKNNNNKDNIYNNKPYLVDEYWRAYLLYHHHTNKKYNIYNRTSQLLHKFPSKLRYFNKDNNGNVIEDIIYPYKHILKRKYVDGNNSLYNLYNNDDNIKYFDDEIS